VVPKFTTVFHSFIKVTTLLEQTVENLSVAVTSPYCFKLAEVPFLKRSKSLKAGCRKAHQFTFLNKYSTPDLVGCEHFHRPGFAKKHLKQEGMVPDPAYLMRG